MYKYKLGLLRMKRRLVQNRREKWGVTLEQSHGFSQKPPGWFSRFFSGGFVESQFQASGPTAEAGRGPWVGWGGGGLPCTLQGDVAEEVGH